MGQQPFWAHWRVVGDPLYACRGGGAKFFLQVLGPNTRFLPVLGPKTELLMLLFLCVAQKGPLLSASGAPPWVGSATTAMADKDDYQVSAGNGSSTQGCL
jgi:hypothetical protein